MGAGRPVVTLPDGSVDTTAVFTAVGVQQDLAQRMGEYTQKMMKELRDGAMNEKITPSQMAQVLANAQLQGKLAELAGKSMEEISKMVENIVNLLKQM